jgi:hypothetical protein
LSAALALVLTMDVDAFSRDDQKDWNS